MAQPHVILKTDCQGQNSTKTISKSKVDVVTCWRVRKKWGVSCCYSSLSSLIFMYWFTLQIRRILSSTLQSLAAVSAPGLWKTRRRDRLLSRDCNGCERVSPRIAALGSGIPPSVQHLTCKLDEDARCVKPFLEALLGGVSSHNIHINPSKRSR